MNLPTLKEQTTVEVTLKGYPLNLRRMTFQDAEALMEFRQKDYTNIGANLWLIATLMTGYDEDFETRLKWINSIQIEGAEDFAETDRVLGAVGIGEDAEKSKKK
jgi:hypothetical protein